MPAPSTRVDLALLYQDAGRCQLQRIRRWRRVALGVSAAAAALLLMLGLRLELRVEAHQFVVRWGTPPENPQPPAAQPAPNNLATLNPENLYLAQQLIHALADDVAARARENQEALGNLEARLDALRQQQQERWDATQRLASTLYTLATTSVAKKE